VQIIFAGLQDDNSIAWDELRIRALAVKWNSFDYKPIWYSVAQRPCTHYRRYLNRKKSTFGTAAR
jgi:hypothetical protein